MRGLLQTIVLLIVSIHAAAQGTQFITGPCTADADCASACCGFNSGKCAGPVVAQERDGGCGFGSSQPNNNAALALTGGTTTSAEAEAVPEQTSPATGQASDVGTGAALPKGTQFITGICTSDADCASACCGFKSGKCAAPAVAQERDGGCGFGNPQPNDDALKALQRRVVVW